MAKKLTAIRVYPRDRNKFNRVVKSYKKTDNTYGQQHVFRSHIDNIIWIEKGGMCPCCAHNGNCNTDGKIILNCDEYLNA